MNVVRREAADEAGWLGGLTGAIKHLTNVAGGHASCGSPPQIFRDHVPTTPHPAGTVPP
jgi:hypothetical protein